MDCNNKDALWSAGHLYKAPTFTPILPADGR